MGKYTGKILFPISSIPDLVQIPHFPSRIKLFNVYMYICVYFIRVPILMCPKLINNGVHRYIITVQKYTQFKLVETKSSTCMFADVSCFTK